MAQVRVPVEQFFGRLYSLWAVARLKYRWSHEYFNHDIDNCILLSNEHIEKNQLKQTDCEFKDAFISNRAFEAEKKLESRAEKQKESSKKKRARLSEIYESV